jgi:hypothetical protein
MIIKMLHVNLDLFGWETSADPTKLSHYFGVH